jgi:probable F420-dependent oxidoreductase
VRFSYGLPTHRVDRGEELASGRAIAELAAAAESAGFDAVYTTEHPFPDDGWLAHGGHHALDPLVALSFAAAATSRVRLHTNLFVLPYRNPFLAAKGLATLDFLSGGRLIVGIGAGYLEQEFEALGSSYDDRNERIDESIEAMRTAWTGESVTMSGIGFTVHGNTMLPRPVQRPHPPIWIGGNSRRAIRRAVERGDGWSPFPAPARFAGRTHTAALATVEDLADGLAYAGHHAMVIGRQTPLDVCFVPEGLGMGAGGELDVTLAAESCRALAAVGARRGPAGAGRRHGPLLPGGHGHAVPALTEPDGGPARASVTPGRAGRWSRTPTPGPPIPGRPAEPKGAVRWQMRSCASAGGTSRF